MAIRDQDALDYHAKDRPGKIEVAEFFWYGCGHCYTFEPVIGQWKKTLPLP